MAPHFKKLTDCPENLREAIDWLIQVRHGGDGRGLGQLAKALKKLVDEVITKATKSLEAEHDKLVCPFQYSATETNCQHYQTLLENRKKEITDAGTPQDFEKDAEVKRLKGNITYCKNKYHNEHYRDASKQKSLDYVKERKNDLENHKTKLEAFIGKVGDKVPNSIPAKGILENLCTGLETFLGFNKESKGYTGNGIVYSDLDRLCDAVMAFLHGVLESVKSDDAVKTYDKNLKTNEQLNNVLENLKSSIGKGSDDFAPRVREVSGWLGKYRGELIKKMDNVTGPLNALKTHLEAELYQVEKQNVISKKVLYKKITAAEVEEIVTRCIFKLQNGMKEILETKNSGLHSLDTGLQSKISESLKRIKKELARFGVYSERDRTQLEAMKVKIREQLEQLKEVVNNEVESRVTQLEQHLTSEFTNTIQTLIVKVNDALHSVFKDLTKWIERAEKIAQYGIAQAQKILDEVNDKDGMGREPGNSAKRWSQVVTAATKLKDRAHELYSAANKTKKQIQVAVNAALYTVGTLDTGLKQDLKNVKNAINAAIKKYMETLGMQLDAAVRNANGWSGNGTDAVNKLKTHLKENRFQFENVLRLLENKTPKFPTFSTDFAWLLEAINSHLKGHFELITKEGIFVDAITKDIEKPLNDQLPDHENDRGTSNSVTITKDTFTNYKDHIDQADDNLSSLVQGQVVVTKGSNRLPRAIDDIKTRVLQQEYLGKVESTAQTPTGVKGDGRFYGDTFQNMLTDVEWRLSELMRTIRNLAENTNESEESSERKGVRNYFEELHNIIKNEFGGEYNKHLDKIKERIEGILKSNTEGNLQIVLSNANKFLQTITTKSASTIQDIKTTVEREANKKIKNISEQAEKQYVDSRIHELSILTTVVQKQYTLIHETTRTSKDNGIKGMLEKLKTDFVHDLEPFSSFSKAVLKDGAGEVSKWYRKFLGTLSFQDEVQMVAGDFTHLVESLESFFGQMKYSQHFDHRVTEVRQKVENALSGFAAETFKDAPKSVLLPLKKGLSDFMAQHRYAYVSTYCSQTFTGDLVETEAVAYPLKDEQTTKTRLTVEGRNCAKACLSTVNILYRNFAKLRERCPTGRDWNELKMHKNTELGDFLGKCGYGVSDTEMQNGELQNKDTMTGKQLHTLLFSKLNSVFNGDSKAPIIRLRDCLNDYNKTCHLATLPATRYPSNVNQMLQWCSGLRYNHILQRLCGYVKELFPKRKEDEKRDYSQIETNKLTLAATTEITYNALVPTIGDVCDHAEKMLIAIQGHGHADGVYACDFSNNSSDLVYPAVPSQCLDMLVDVSSRLHQQLFFLYEQCRHGQAFGAWNRCWYGRGVGGSAWNCNDLYCADQTGNQKHNQRCDQKCDQITKCGIKSPLQSFLEDGLTGFLPHPITSVGCGVKCSLGNHGGLPCKTPMGFSDLSFTASHRQTGEHLEAVLAELCGNPDSPLSQLCSYITCLLPPTPQILGDMFAFYYNFLNKWNSNDGHKRLAFVNAVRQANFGDIKTTLEISQLFGHTDHTSETHPNANLYSLVKCEYNGGDAALPWGPYLRPLSRDILNTFSDKHAGKYLSWIVYLTETFYDLLKKLYDDCCERCDKRGTRCHDKSCAEKCEVKYTNKEGEPIILPKTANHDKDCSSIVQCPHTLRTLCKYGFYFGSSWRMRGRDTDKTKRTCRDLCRALERVLSTKESDGAALATLIYKAIPNFLFTIRAPFIWTILALWLLSLLYLLHIMVIRLDLLHIKSHLHSPSSHRIAAQSLLAVARVGKLAKLTYLQP